MERDEPSIAPRTRASSAPWAFFACGGKGYAVRLDQVHEIVPPQPLTRIPGCGREVCGLLGLRGRVVTVFDFGVLAGGRASVDQPDHRLVLLHHGSTVVGLAVDQVLTIASFEEVEVDKAATAGGTVSEGVAAGAASVEVETGGPAVVGKRRAAELKAGDRTFMILHPDDVFGELLA